MGRSHLHKDTDKTQAITCSPVALNRVLVNSGNRKSNLNVIDLLVVLSINDIKLALQFYLRRLTKNDLLINVININNILLL
jgi:hypothetical protein